MYTWQIEIKELDDIAQAAFHGYKSLNRIQSRIFQTTYYTNENILVKWFLYYRIYINCRMKWNWSFDILEMIFVGLQVCAPTGAGKTNIAMIAILHEVCIVPIPFFYYVIYMYLPAVINAIFILSTSTQQ